MEYIENDETVERVYEVHFDSEKLKELLDKIVKNASRRTDGKFTAPYNSKFEGNVFTSGATLMNGDPMYENIEKISSYTSYGPHSYHNDFVEVVGTEVKPPKLAYIIYGILLGEEYYIYSFIDYANHEELIPIDEEIANTDKEINSIDNFDYYKKIAKLEHLKYLCEAKEAKEYYDAELLKKYYLEARNLIELELVSEKTLKNDIIPLKAFRPLTGNK